MQIVASELKDPIWHSLDTDPLWYRSFMKTGRGVCVKLSVRCVCANDFDHNIVLTENILNTKLSVNKK